MTGQGRRRSALLCGGLVWASTALAQPASLLPTVQAIRAQYPTPMSEAQRGEFLNRIAWQHRAEGWGLLRKDGGSRCPAPQGVTVACDILIHAPSVRHFDVLIDGEGKATPDWADVGPCVLGPSSGCEMARFVAPVAPSGQDPPVPPDAPQPPDPGVIEAIRKEIAQLRAFIGTLAETAREHHDRINALIQHAREVDGRLQAVTGEIEALKARPQFATCKAALNLGMSRIPISCALQ